MGIVGTDISKAKFDAALLTGERVKHGAFSNTEAGFAQLITWLARHQPNPAVPLRAMHGGHRQLGPGPGGFPARAERAGQRGQPRA